MQHTQEDLFLQQKKNKLKAEDDRVTSTDGLGDRMKKVKARLGWYSL
jgi:hypothetical protein